MTHYDHGSDYTAATYDDTVTNAYGETVRIIGETPKGTSWVTVSATGNRAILFKCDYSTRVYGVAGVSS